LSGAYTIAAKKHGKNPTGKMRQEKCGSIAGSHLGGGPFCFYGRQGGWQRGFQDCTQLARGLAKEGWTFRALAAIFCQGARTYAEQ
jgi:hypothetical protein